MGVINRQERQGGNEKRGRVEMATQGTKRHKKPETWFLRLLVPFCGRPPISYLGLTCGLKMNFIAGAQV
jgi:hypothetical protein